jgi:hypothetical protein
VTKHLDAVIRLLREMGESRPSDGTIHLVECGLHSGFLPCCVIFFVQVWIPLRDGEKSALAASDEYLTVVRSLRGGGRGGHIPCPDCLRKRRVVVPKKCSRHLSKRERDYVRKALA